jgi:PKD repeat protein
MKNKALIGVIILFFIGASIVPSITGNFHGKKYTVYQSLGSSKADVTIIDSINDVCSVDYYTGETVIVTFHPDINVQNLDINKTTYTQVESQATVTLQVEGNIENRGPIDINDTDINAVEYDFQLITSDGEYLVSYSNLTGQFYNGYDTINLTSSDFSISGDTLCITFPLLSAEEVYENLSATSMFIKVNLSHPEEPEDIVYLSDIVPNPPLEILEVYAPNTGYVGETIQFNASIVPLTGLPPYTYNWDFGDQGTSSLLNPTHVYTKAGIYIYTFTVIDNAGATANKSGSITIQEEELKKAFLFGKFTNMIAGGDYIAMNAVNMRMISFKPFEFRHFIAGEQITVLNQFFGVWTERFLIGLFNVASISEPPHTPNIACTTDSTLNRLIVACADSNIKWSDIDITNDTGSLDFHWALYTDGGVTNSSTNIIPLGKYVTAGDYLQFWWSLTGNVRITFRYIPTNELLGTWTLNV